VAQNASLQDDFRKDGYSREEEYFYRINRELIERKRQELDAARAARREENETKAHWMRCPKCGGRMESVNLLKIQVDRCSRCQGVFLDRGELDTLLQVKESHTFLARLKKLFELPQKGPGMF
jgi:Zn-finger nucleic acid-binding protein